MKKQYITLGHVIFEIVSYVLLLAGIIYIIIFSSLHPGEIPMKYDWEREVLATGSPLSLLSLPIIMAVANGSISLCIHLLPVSTWNMPVKVKAEHAVPVYRDTVWMMVLFELEIALYSLFFLLDMTIGKKTLLGGMTILLVIALFGTIIFSMVRVVHDNR